MSKIQNDKPLRRVVITVSGGVAEIASKRGGVEVTIYDYDTDGVDESCLCQDDKGNLCAMDWSPAHGLIPGTEDNQVTPQASLFAAAPDLLAACKVCLNILEGIRATGNIDWRDAERSLGIHALQAAIAKAVRT